ncbi:MAG TPA: flagellar biosynthesis protein FlaG [Clostridium sp.]|nr:flagellar biosynthesis protein FlaG [Clostridium sp.]
MYIDSVANNSEYYINNIANEGNEIQANINKNPQNNNYDQLSNNYYRENQIDKKNLDKSIDKLNRFLEDESAHAEYSVHEDLGTVMIKIVDDATKEVILEVPPKKILDMVASMCKQFGLIDKKA